jgi:signal peptidase II
MFGRKNIFIINSLIFTLFVIDRIFKYIFLKTSLLKEVFIFGDFLKLKLAFNSGIAFGLPVNYYLLLGLYALILVGLVWFLVSSYRERKIWSVFFSTMVIVGAFSNLLDRIYVGQVIDYIDVKYYSVFNVADVMIVFGILGLAIGLSKKNK